MKPKQWTPLRRCAVVIGGCVLALWLLGWALSPRTQANTSAAPTGVVEVAAKLPELYKLGAGASVVRHTSVAPAHESPLLADLVQQQKLPPLAQRMPADPVVMEGTDGIGRYGGTWMRLAPSSDDVNIIGNRLSGAFLARWSSMGYPLEMHIAKSIEPSADKKIWTVALRPGLCWSDGAEFTADDILYWWNDEALNKHVSTGIAPLWMSSGGKPGTIEKIDQYHVRFVFQVAYPLFVETLASTYEPTNTPAHYLRPYNPDPKIGDAALIAREQRAYGLPSPSALYTFVKAWQNPEHPRLWPWLYRAYSSTTPQIFTRNPYYFAIDTQGNQLPYVDRLQFDIIDSQLFAVSAANGAVSMQERGLKFGDYTEIMSRRAIAGTRVLNWYPATRSAWVINPNLNRRVDPNDGQTGEKERLLSDKRFRQALSLAIDRDAIIKAEWVGVGEPSQVQPGPSSPFQNQRLGNAFIEHDPARAKRLLDDMGLTQFDSEGFRTAPGGRRLTFFLDYCIFTGAGPVQFVVDDWAKVGIRAVSRERARPLFQTEKDSREFDFHVWTSESDAMPLLQPRYFIPNDAEAYYAVGWALWWQAGGIYDSPASHQPNMLPVPADHPMHRAMQCYAQAIVTTDVDEQKRLMGEVTDIAAENLWTISIATPPPALVIVGQGMKNVPEHAATGYMFASPSNTGIETYFFETPAMSPGAIEATQQAILHTTPIPGSSAARKNVSTLGKIMAWTIWPSIGIALLALGIRYPFIGRRLLIMIPTLAVISIVIFTIIRLPPGDYLTTRVMQLEENGDNTAERQIADLTRMFHYEDSQLQLYLRWTGLRWFATYDTADLGLLQGNLGRSMETLQPIDSMIGDRITLTVLISVATIALTWALALPIGIYSAVRQYSFSDYVLTLIGFIGMCVPAFLLALALMAVSGLSGLFSPQFAAQPEWNWPKFVDLLKHLWVPVIVLGVGGTAGMIRVMRANLLDELRRPYVVTARAKGVRPTKLLLKYPVRLALNPFVSSIGGLFPALVSGNAIVSIVLALPTVGPLMLKALFNQDTYLAGSMLMVLSVLGIAGTLVSDLLLLWLDPRIRFEGGGR